MLEDIISQLADDVSVLVEAGMVAVKYGEDRHATILFSSAKIISKTETLPDTCMGYLHLQRFELGDAKKLFLSVLQKDSTNYLAMTMLGVCLSFSPKTIKDGLSLINKAKLYSKDPNVIEVCSAALKWVNNDSRFKVKNNLPM